MNVRHEPLAIIGIGCRFPGGANGAASFWRFLKEGRDGIVEVPADRWNADAYYSPLVDAPGKSVCRWGGFTEGPELFDAQFFGISPREAACIDPQHRWLLEVAYEALEDAGLAMSPLRGSRTGVFVGISTEDYGRMQQAGAEEGDLHSAIGAAASIAANRISYFFDLRGPSMVVDTACSSSLTAVCLACQSLWRGEIDLAFVGGANALLSPESTIGFSRAGMLSASGRCRAFAADADGYVRSEGAGVVLLQREGVARAAGHRIYALIRSVGLNEDGRSASLPVPSRAAQEDLLKRTCRETGVSPGAICYVEAHGTGTPVGDPIEAGAIGAVIGPNLEPGERCLIGSVKTNIGHLESASGIAALIKTALILQHHEVVANLHFSKPSPHIDFETLRLEVPLNSAPLQPRSGQPLLALASSFGFGGANACVLLQADEGAPKRVGPPTGARRAVDDPVLIPLSARSSGALVESAARYAELFNEETELDLELVAAATALRRSHHPWRAAFLGASHSEMTERLLKYSQGEKPGGVFSGRAGAEGLPRLVFVFSGQGGHWCKMALGLLGRGLTFERSLNELDRLIKEHAGWSALAELRRGASETRLGRTDISQPLLFALQVALLHQWKSWGINPDALIGHSVGEVAAAYAAGILELESALKLVLRRSELQQRQAGKGGMTALRLSAREAADWLKPFKGRLEIAALNAPFLVTVSGDAEALQELEQVAVEKSVFFKRLQVDCAFHSAQMDPLKEELLDSLQDLSAADGVTPFYSTVTGTQLSGRELDAGYWWRNIRAPVRFADAVSAACQTQSTFFLEIGPHALLSPSIEQILRDGEKHRAVVCATLYRDRPEWRSLLQALAHLYCSGFDPCWQELFGHGHTESTHQVPLPRYPWQRERHWRESSLSRRHRFLEKLHPLLGHKVFCAQSVWESFHHLKALPYLSDHRVQGSVIMPAAAMVELGLAAAHQLRPATFHTLENLEFLQPIPFSSQGHVRTQLAIQPDDGTCLLSAQHGDTDNQWYAAARWEIGEGRPARVNVDLNSIQERFFAPQAAVEIGAAQFYEETSKGGFDFGPAFQGVRRVWLAPSEALGEISLPELVQGEIGAYFLHPAALDACMQAAGALLTISDALAGSVCYVPIRMRRVRFYSYLSACLWVHALAQSRGGQRVLGDFRIYDQDGVLAAEVEGFELQQIRISSSETRTREMCYFPEWQEQPRPIQTEVPSLSSPLYQPGVWLIFTDRQGVGERLAELLETQNDRCVRIDRGDLFKMLGEDHFQVPPQDPSGFADLFDHIQVRHFKGILYGWGDSADSDSSLGLLHLTQSMLGTESQVATRLWVLAPTYTLAAAALWGLGRAVQNELPNLPLTVLELERGSARETASQIFEELFSGAAESEISLVGGHRRVRRLVMKSLETLPPRFEQISSSDPGVGAALETLRPGMLSKLALRRLGRQAPAANEVEIKIAAAGLNFRDVLKALGLYPADAEDTGWFGDECAGYVSAFGSDVQGYQVGDEVLALGRGCMGTHVLTPCQLVAHKPSDMSMAEAAALPVAFLTAWWALERIGRLQPGESVLVHAAAGGVGQAAVQVAQLLGAEVYASAGNERKRAYLREMGVKAVVDSRSLSFAEDIMELTDGRGVDVVLNSLAGEFITKSLSVLASGGRFLELGKRDIYQNRRLGLGLFKRNISFSAIDLAAMIGSGGKQVAPHLARLLELFKEKRLRPLPCSLFPAEKASEAFRHMSQAKHIGKIVLDFSAQNFRVLPLSKEAPEFRKDRSFLISGGLGGFGLESARWLANRGAGCLVLISRSGAPMEESGERILQELKDAGTRVVIKRADVAEREELARVLEEVRRELPPLQGVLHAAAVLEDVPLRKQDAGSFLRVCRPKIRGAWNLHELTKDLPLEFFILYSSISAWLGMTGQSSYAAANSYLDALAHYRRNLGLPALSVNWSGITGTGVLSRNARTCEFMQKEFGLTLDSLEQAFGRLGEFLQRDLVQAGGFDLDWRKARGYLAPALRNGLFGGILQGQQPDKAQVSAGAAAVLAALEGSSTEELRALMLEYLKHEVAKVLAAESADLDCDLPLAEIGMDSLMAFQLKVQLDAELGLNLEPGRFATVPSLRELSESLLEALKNRERRGC
ncbi:MAG: type I polyketide synthase [Deltaproteobacteria bacterium]|nr:type I polyketide synthase [Deltaproteobacteria bacterium]